MTRWIRLVVAAGVAAAAAGCSTTTGGTGAVGAATVAGGSESSATSPDSRPAASQASTPSTPAPPGSSGAPAPRECATATSCTLVKSWNVGGGYVVAAFSAPAAANGIGSTVLLLARDGTPVFWHVFGSETPSELLCKVSGSLQNCGLVNHVGAHGAIAYPILLVSGQVVIGEPVGTDTPGLHVADLNGDLLVDAYGLQNDYRPDYASGHVQWQTWRRAQDASSFASTGCGPLSRTASADPATFLAGKCTAG